MKGASVAPPSVRSAVLPQICAFESKGKLAIVNPQRRKKQGFAMLRAEREMNVQFGERLRHADSSVSPLQGLRSGMVSPLDPGRWPISVNLTASAFSEAALVATSCGPRRAAVGCRWHTRFVSPGRGGIREPVTQKHSAGGL
jgi:hypothetical protein